MKWNTGAALAAVLLLFTSATANAQIRITEWMYSSDLAAPNAGEFIEITNVGLSAVDMSTYSYDDNSRAAGSFSLAGLGTLAPGESAIISEDDAATFRSAWSLPASVKVAGSNSQNLGRSDEINIYNGAALVDRLTYGDQVFAGTIRTQDISGIPMTVGALGANDVTLWQYAMVGDQWGSYLSSYGAIGNPGSFSLVPEPSTVVLFALGTIALVGRRLKNLVRTRRAS